MSVNWKCLRLVPLAVALALGGCATSRTEAPPMDAPQTWADAGSDIPADEAVRFGQLPNGMRYALMHNATPAGAAALRLRFDSGSLQERDDQRGLAHFIEHLVLNETRNVPEGELIRILERAGLSFGADVNAFTQQEQTFYMLDLPHTDAQTVDTALFLLREVAAEATLSDAVIEGERGVILAEERASGAPLERMIEDELEFLFAGDPVGNRMPIGSPEVIRTAPRERFVEYYDGFYRPERATLIAVGDFDPDEMEAKIRERFSDWQGRGEPAPDLAPLSAVPAGDRVRVVQTADIPTKVTLSWVAPREPGLEDMMRRTMEARRSVALAIFARRLERLAAGDDAPFIGAIASRSRISDRAELTQIFAVSQPNGWALALQRLEQEQRRAVEHGFTQSEVDREVNHMRGLLYGTVRGSATRSSPNIAMAILNAVNEDRVYSSPDMDMDLFDAAVDGLTAEEATTVFREMFADAPAVHLATTQSVADGEAAVRTALASSRQIAVAAPEAVQARSWPYTSFGETGQVVERRDLPEVGATSVRFANGVRVTVKSTEFSDDEVSVSVRFGHGLLGLPADRVTPVWTLPIGGFTGGGLGQLDFDEIQRALAGTSYALSATIDEDAYIMVGSTDANHLDTQLQLLAAYFRDPAWRSSTYDRLKALGDTVHDTFAATPEGVFQRDSAGLLYPGDRRFDIPSREEIAASTVSELSAVIAPALANGPVEVIIVGDVGVDAAIEDAAATFGALSLGQGQPAALTPLRRVAPGSATRTHRGRADQALGFIAWPTTDGFTDPRRALGLDLLARVFQSRLMDEIRERQGVAYSPQASQDGSRAVVGLGQFQILVEVPPAALESFFQSAQAIARSLREEPISADELDRARRPLVEAMQRSRTSDNAWWIEALGGLGENPQRAATLRDAVSVVAGFTAADLQNLAREYLVDDRAWRLSVLPEQETGAIAAATTGQ